MIAHRLRQNSGCGLILILWACPAATSTTCAAEAVATATKAVTVSRRDGWCVAESPNFRCCTCQGEQAAQELARACEDWRTRLCKTWGNESATGTWTPRCEIVVHPTQIAYCSALCRPGDSSVGSTQMRFDGGRVVLCRIDLRCDAADWTEAALPHELTHVVLAERFRDRPLRPWADEGLAMLSESSSKRETRLADLRHALKHRPTYSVRDLLAVRQLPPAHLRDAFYGQSLALTSWLIERSSPQDFARFLDACHEQSVDEALRKELALAGLDGLEREWQNWTRSPASMVVLDLWDSAVATELPALAKGD